MPTPTQLTRRELVVNAHEALPHVQRKDISDLVDNVFAQIENALASGRDAEFRGFGIFRLVRRAARPGRNPLKPENTVLIPAKVGVKFKPGNRLARKLDMLSAEVES